MKHQSMPETIRARLIVVPESEDVLPSGGDSSSTLIETSNLDILRKFFDFDPDKRSVRPQYIYRGENQDTEATTSTSVDISGMNQEQQFETNMEDRYLWLYDRPKQERVYVTSYKA
ncbi:hypothetical protein HS088_TW21G00324 [Tripterygium wilfordii]|uniref:Uncharacterized protein n=2 Tax=Tripterygium wilfordii TaxID=458696 RepID=A0A7J7C200_TRIWF|nr:hypothetical protein HS088_TW21G00324 [Tripterygium wilfordii]